MPLWVKLYSPSENEYYYYNNRSGASVWQEPDDYVKPPGAMPARFLMSREVDAAFTIARGEDHVVIAFPLEVRGVCSSSSSFLCGWSTLISIVSGIYSILKVVAVLFAVKRLSIKLFFFQKKKSCVSG